MKFLRKVLLRSPESVYRAYASWAGMQFVLHALLSVFIMSVPAALTVFAFTGSVAVAIVLAPFFTILVVQVMFHFMKNNRMTTGKKLLYGDAKIDRELSLLAAPICRKAGFTPIPVMPSLDENHGACLTHLEADVFMLTIRPDIRHWHTTQAIRGIIAHEVGHLCVPFQRFIRMVTAGYLRPMDFLCLCFRVLERQFLKECNGERGEFPVRSTTAMFRVLSNFFWLFSFSRSEQLNEYAADCQSALLLGDAFPLVGAFVNLVKHGAGLGEEGEIELLRHPPLVSRLNRLLDINFAARHAPQNAR